MDENFVPENEVDEQGTVKISDEVIALVAGVATNEIEGVFSMNGGLAEGIATFLGGRKNVSKGIKVTVGEESTTIDIHITVEYGARIPEVAWQIQERVKEAVETMTGMRVAKVNIHVDGVNIEKPKTEAEETEEEEE